MKDIIIMKILESMGYLLNHPLFIIVCFVEGKKVTEF